MQTARLASMFAVLVMASGCRDTTDSRDPPGLFRLQTVDGKALPFVLDSILEFEGTIRIWATGGTIQLLDEPYSVATPERVVVSSDTTARLDLRLRDEFPDSVINRSYTAVGTYEVRADTLRLCWDLSSPPLIAVFCDLQKYEAGVILARRFITPSLYEYRFVHR